MAKDDYFKIVYVVLKELYECKKANEKINLSAIAPGRFEAEPGYMLEIFEELIEAGYIKGVIIENTNGQTHREPGRHDDHYEGNRIFARKQQNEKGV